MQDLATEVALALFLRRDRALIGSHVIEGEDDAVKVDVRDVIRRALAVDAVGMVFAHNHPSGDPAASRADLNFTRRLAFTASGVRITLFDHLIFARTGVTSMRSAGLL
jgi:DNA repair protein RadC